MDGKPRFAAFAPSKPQGGLTERHENRSFNGAAKPRPTRNFRAADFISSLDGGGAPVLKRCLFFFALLVLLAFLGLAGAVGLAPKPDLWGGADFSRVVTDRSGRVLRVTLTRDEKYRIFTPLERIPAAMREADILY